MLRIMQIVMLFLIVLGSSAPRVAADRTGEVGELIDRIEARLQELELAQSQGGEALHALSQLPAGELPPALVGSINELEKQLQELAEKLDGMKSDQQAKSDVMRALAGELRHLFDLMSAPGGGCVTEEEVEVTLSISGFVDASYFHDGPSATGSFGFDQGEVDLSRTIGAIGEARLDMEWVSDGDGGFAMDAEQGFVVFSPEALGPMAIQFGKFNAPIGFECLDPPDMYQYSHALVFDYGLPTNVTGAMISAASDKGFDFSLYLCNGWDQNTDVNENKTIGVRLGFTPGERFGLGVSTITGSQTAAEGKDLTVFDVDATATPMPALTLGAEFNYGKDESGAETAEWMGALVMGHYDFSEVWGLTVRVDYFDDKDASRLGSEMEEVRHSIAFSPTFCLGDGMGALLEFRVDSSDEEVFENKDGEPSKSASFFAFEMTYTF